MHERLLLTTPSCHAEVERRWKSSGTIGRRRVAAVAGATAKTVVAGVSPAMSLWRPPWRANAFGV